MAIKIKFTTPFLTARYPHISSPDTKGKFADNKFKTKLVGAAGDKAVQDFVAKIDDAFERVHGKGSKVVNYRPYDLDEEANEYVFNFKTQYAPAIFDAKNKPAKGVKIGGGSVLRLAGQFVEFDKGISAQFNQVQIKELNGFGSSAFEEVDDGYAFDEEDVEQAFEGPAETDAEGSTSDALDI